MSNAIVYVVVMDENFTPMPNIEPVFTPSLPFVSINGQGNPPRRTVTGGASWFMGVQQGTVITVSAPGFASAIIDTFRPGTPFIGTTHEMPIEANLLPLGTWTWTSPTPLATNTSPAPGAEATVSWKSNYAVGGTLQNLDQSSFTAELALTQTGPWTTAPGGPSSLVATQGASVGRGASVPVSFGLFSQDWVWFEQATGIPTGPALQFVSYSLSITITNGTGNKLNISPPNLIVLVSVPPWKAADQLICQAAFDNSVILAIAAAAGGFLPPLALALGAAAVAAQALAQGEAAAANDPPEPSLAFDRVERFQPMVMGGPDDPETSNIKALLSCGLRVTEARRVLSITEGRLEGARRAGTQNDVNRQVGHYHTVTAIVRADLASVQEFGTKADQELTQVIGKLKRVTQTQPESLKHPGSPGIIPSTGMAPRIFQALSALSDNLENVVRVYDSVLDNIRQVPPEPFARLARGLANAIEQIVNDDRQLAQTARQASL
jgi:hypothetical protein